MSGLTGAPFPPRRSVADFFSRRAAQSIGTACALLGWPEEVLRRRVAEESELLPGEHLPWADVALWLFEVWGWERIVDVLGRQASLLPSLLVPRRVSWRIPAYIILAVKDQTARDHPHWSAGDFVAHHLHQLFDEETAGALLGDVSFARAYRFPEQED